MKNTTAVGDAAVAALMSALLQAGVAVSLPFGHGQRYDVVADVDGQLFRVQCKNGRLESGCIEFNTHSVNVFSGGVPGTKAYRGQIDYFGVYCAANKGVYLIPVDEVGTGCGYLRVGPPRNGQTKGIRWASDFEVSKVIAGLRSVTPADARQAESSLQAED